jgi:hypothetical protein
MQSMRGYWQGDTSDDIKNVGDAVQRSARICCAPERISHNLNELAGIYDKTEKTYRSKAKPKV